MKFPFTEIWVLTKYLVRLHLLDCCNMVTVTRKKLKWKVQSDNLWWDRLKSKQCMKIIQNWENLNSLIFSTHFRTVIISNKMAWLLHSSLWFRFIVRKIFFPDNTSAIAHLYGCTMAELWVTDHSGFMKDFVSSTKKNIDPFDISSIETSASIQTSNLRIFPS